MNNDDSGAAMYRSQWQERIGWRLFPSQHIDAPEITSAKDVLVCRTVAHLSFLDRLRVLISGKVVVTSKTTTENKIGDQATASCVHIAPPGFLDRK